MPHGYPDYGVGAPIQTVYTMLDMGELAARLGSILTFDRRGNILFFDNFEDSLNHWRLVSEDATGTAEITNAYARRGAFSVKVVTPVTSGYFVGLEHFEPIPPITSVGFEFSFTIQETRYILELETTLDTGKHRHIAKVQYYDIASQLEYWGQDDNYHAMLPIFTIYPLVGAWNTLKLVVDYTTFTYKRLLFNSYVLPIAGVEYRHYDFPATPRLYTRIRLFTKTAAIKTIYIDDVIITQNEP